jgi:rubredoxin-NAD+ reductase
MATQLQARVLTRCRVITINTEARQVHVAPINDLRNDIRQSTQKDAACATHAPVEIIDYAQLVLALGAEPLRLPIAGNAADHIRSVNDLEDYRAFRNALSRCTAPARVAILGGGLIGCEFANDLAIAGHAVQIIDIAPQALGRLLPSDVPGAVRGPAQSLQQALQQTGVQWHLGRSLKAIQHSAAASTLELHLDNGDSLEADLVLSAVGLAPRTALAASAGLQIGRGIVTNQCLQTSARHVYALGDCAEVNGMLLPYVMPIMHGARALAATLASYQDTHDSVQAQSVHYPPMPVSVKTPALPITVCSPAMGSAGAWVAASTANADTNAIEAHFLSPEGKLLGFALTGTACSRRSALVRALVRLPGDALSSSDVRSGCSGPG